MNNTFRNHSKQDWNSENTIEAINAGSLQRIADATEKMSANYVNLQNDLDRYKRWYSERCEVVSKKNKTISSLRGQITKLKNKLATKVE